MAPISSIFFADGFSGQDGYVYATNNDCAGGIGTDTYLDLSVGALPSPFIETSWDDGDPGMGVPYTKRNGMSFWDTSTFVLIPGNYITEIKYDIFCKDTNGSTPTLLSRQLSAKADYADAEALFNGLYPTLNYASFTPTLGNWDSVILGPDAILDFLADPTQFALSITADVASAPQNTNVFHSTRAVDEFSLPYNIPFLTITQDVIPVSGDNGWFLMF